MSDPRACPVCDGGELVCRDGRLDQCGDTYLPTKVVSCARCGYAEFEAALGVHWRSAVDEPPTPAPPVPHRLRAA